MRLLVLSSLFCILLLFFPVEGRRRHIRSKKMQLCCLVTRLNGTTLKAPRPSKASWENPALLVPPPRPRSKNPGIKTRDSVHFAASKNPVQRRASSGHYMKICRLCKIKSSVPYRWVVPGALPQV